MKTKNQQRIDRGFKFVAHGFELAFRHPMLLVYPFIFLSIPMGLAISRNFELLHTHSPEYAYHLFTHPNTESLIAIALILTFFILLAFVASCITIHTNEILDHKRPSVRTTLRSLIHHAPHLVIWGVTNTFVIYSGLALKHIIIIQLQEIPWALTILGILAFLASTLWGFAIFFMIQIDSLEHFSLLESFKRSCVLASKYIVELIAARVAYDLTVGILGLLIVTLMVTLQRFALLPDPYQSLLEGFVASAVLMSSFIIYMVFTTMLYHQHRREE